MGLLGLIRRFLASVKAFGEATVIARPIEGAAAKAAGAAGAGPVGRTTLTVGAVLGATGTALPLKKFLSAGLPAGFATGFIKGFIPVKYGICATVYLRG